MCVSAVLLFVSGARAQGEDDLSVSVVFGWQGTMPADRWAPITVSVSPGDSPLGGMVIAEYQQDASGAARFSVPFAATPGTTTPVQVMVALPEQCNRVDLTLMDEAGRVRWRQTFESITRNFAQPLPTLLGAETPVMAVVGRTTLFEAMRDWPTLVASSNFAESGTSPQRVKFASDSAWTHVAPARADVTALPTAWIAYDGLAMLVVVPDAAEPPDGRAVEAIHAWVASGGRLIVRADAPGDGWRAWVPEAMTRGIEVESARTMPVPKEARAAIDRVAARSRSIKESPDAGSGIAGADAPVPVTGETTQVRPIRVDGPGWVVHWDGAEAKAGVVVEGRLGFGSILLLGFDPAKCTTVASTIGGGAVWRAAIEPAVTDYLDAATRPDAGRPNWGTTSVTIQSAVNTVLELVAQVPGVGVGVFILIVACILVLAVLVGPFDFFLLRRLKSLQRSWLTALMWIGVASVAAYAGPRLVRTEITRINRVSVEDCIAGAVAGATEPAPPELANVGGPVAFRAGFTGIYAGEAGVAKFTEPDPASWWRGISVRYLNQQAVGGSGVIPVVQRAAGGASGSSRGGPLVELPLALWTFRSFADESAPAPSIRARVRGGRDGWSVLVSGLPAGARVTEAALRVGQNWCTLDRAERVRLDRPPIGIAEGRRVSGGQVGTMEGGVWAAQFPPRFAESGTPIQWGEVAVSDSYYDFEAAPLDTRPGALTCLPGAARRSRAIEGLVAGGKWAAVYLEVRDWPMDTPISWKAESHHTRILRVLVPLQEE